MIYKRYKTIVGKKEIVFDDRQKFQGKMVSVINSFS